MTGESALWRCRCEGRAYLDAMGFTDIFPRCVDFYEGRQWPAPTAATRHLPRPVFNFCDKYVRTKRANILNQPVQLIFSPAAGGRTHLAEIGARVYTDFAASLWKSIGQDGLNEDFLTDAATLGTGILHYFWEDNPDGGTLCGEVLDPLAVTFGEPQSPDVQRQSYILIATRADVESVRALAKREGLPREQISLITPDDETPDTYAASREERRERKRCTLLTKYYREGGRVFFDRGTRYVTVIRGRSLTPGLPDAGQGESPPTVSAMQRYPVALMQWRRRKRSIYGIGEIEGMIPAQKALNWVMGMSVLSVQDTGWPKMIVRPGALRQEITNTPGEIIEDCSGTGGGISYLMPPGMPAGAAALSERLMTLMQDSCGASEVVTGDLDTGNMAASAIIALQNQAKLPIVGVQKRFYRLMEEVGRIWEEFFRCYCTLPQYAAAGAGGEMVFVGSDFAGVRFSLDVDAGAGSEYSEALGQSTLDRLYDRGDIDLATYAELCSKNVMPFREQLRARLAENEY